MSSDLLIWKANQVKLVNIARSFYPEIDIKSAENNVNYLNQTGKTLTFQGLWLLINFILNYTNIISNF